MKRANLTTEGNLCFCEEIQLSLDYQQVIWTTQSISNVGQVNNSQPGGNPTCISISVKKEQNNIKLNDNKIVILFE